MRGTRPTVSIDLARSRKTLPWLALAAALSLPAAMAGPAVAQQAPDVTVDLDAVDRMGAVRRVSAGSEIILRRPRNAILAQGGTVMEAEAPPVNVPPPVQAAPAAPPTPSPNPSPSTPVVTAPVAPVAPAAPAATTAPAAPAPVVAQPAAPVAPAPEIARLPEPDAVGDTLRIEFEEGSAALPGTLEEELVAIAARMNADPTLRVRLEGHASGPDERSARRLALSRTLAVRLFLTERGVGGSRAIVRALGRSGDDGPEERVDLVLVR